jgi:hypothetical protein
VRPQVLAATGAAILHSGGPGIEEASFSASIFVSFRYRVDTGAKPQNRAFSVGVSSHFGALWGGRSVSEARGAGAVRACPRRYPGVGVCVNLRTIP